MIDIHQWLAVPYKPHGRDMDGCDCWGLVRLVRQQLRGDLLASYGSIAPDSKHALTVAAFNVLRCGAFERTIKPQAGALATVWRGALCIHIGIVIAADGRLAVLETNERSAPRWMRVADFERLYSDVRYYDNAN